MKILGKIALVISLLINANFQLHAQSYSNLIGRIYSNRSVLTELKNCIQSDARVDHEGFICIYFIDTLTNQNVVFVQKESKLDAIISYEILDVVNLGAIGNDHFVLIGSNENKEAAKTSTFLIAIECCLESNKSIPKESKIILSAWTFNTSLKKLLKLKSNKIHRFNEGYYY